MINLSQNRCWNYLFILLTTNVYFTCQSLQLSPLITSDAHNKATIYAAKVPLDVMAKSYDCYDLILKLAKEGNQNSISDAGVACLCVNAAIYGAYLNVKINLKGVSDDKGILNSAKEIFKKSSLEKKNILNYIEEVI